MRTATDFLNMADAVISDGARRGILHRTVEDESANGRTITLDDRTLINFTSCSYLGLELDPRLMEGAIDAVRRYGTQFASSRAYISASMYGEFEALLGQIFGVPTLSAQTTTLGHVAALPVLISEDDAVILDQQVHNSVQMATNHVRLQGSHVELLRHNRMDHLVERIEALRSRFKQVWYLADGVYSMLGDVAPVDTLVTLMDRYEQFRVYIDDAHGMSWTGLHGRGYVLGKVPLHPHMVVATSLAKAFAAGGAALIIPDADERRKVKTVGPSMIFSGPLQPPLLGAAIASARIHLSDELPRIQAEVRERIRLCNQLMMEKDLPLLAASEAPIRLLGLGAPQTAYAMVQRLMEEGFYTNPAVFPAVPRRRAGIRITLTPHVSLDDIRHFVDTFARVLPEVLAQEGYSLSEVRKAFGLGNIWSGAAASVQGMQLQHERSITALDQLEWDSLLGSNGSFTWEGLRFLEETFQGNPEPENNWNFHYLIVRDSNARPVLATFFTDALWKDDMLAHENVSRHVERKRASNPYFLTSRGISMGALLTEGQHLYLDRQADWRKAMLLMLEAVGTEQDRAKASNLIMRDIPTGDEELGSFLMEQGFLKFPMLDSMIIELDWRTDEEWLSRMSNKDRWHQRHEVLPREEMYDTEVLSHGGREVSAGELDHLYRLYQNVRRNNMAINTFPLPRNVFEKMLEHGGWELALLRLRPEHGGDPEGRPVAFTASLVGPAQYAWMIVGLDYRYVQSHGAYRQAMLQVVRRAQFHGSRRVLMGVGASREKRRFGAEPAPHSVYVQSSDQFNSEILVQLMAEVAMYDQEKTEVAQTTDRKNFQFIHS